MGASAARRAKRSGHAVSGCHDGIRERPAMGRGYPRPARRVPSGGTLKTAKVEASVLNWKFVCKRLRRVQGSYPPKPSR